MTEIRAVFGELESAAGRIEATVGHKTDLGDKQFQFVQNARSSYFTDAGGEKLGVNQSIWAKYLDEHNQCGTQQVKGTRDSNAGYQHALTQVCNSFDA
ncbi:hypothetical protein [Actinocrispum wychmicini]|uniref:Uncharacterized protein n=1 Tax=Actinocrispum wychmicini TaxID=1213861 RepID=A0A4R2JD82_9PSEU|nr:hypothetical protein [Actinocrispum wychmicini]TCO54786.1 hypothetical protein EV192_10874 [Actinocrispum wychmicini]